MAASPDTRAINACTTIFENEDGYVKARINVKEKTLLEWAKAVNEDPETVRLRLNNRQPKTRHRK